MSRVATPPHITEVNPNSPEFRAALRRAGEVIKNTVFGVYSAHVHYPMELGEVFFEEQIAPGHLVMHPMLEAEAMQKGLPSCWGITDDGKVEALRYASRALHQASGVDVTDEVFLARLDEIGRAFAAAGADKLLQLNIAGQLFPKSEDTLTLEVTDEPNRRQHVTVIPMSAEVLRDNWQSAACWGYHSDGTPYVVGICSSDTTTTVHKR